MGRKTPEKPNKKTPVATPKPAKTKAPDAVPATTSVPKAGGVWIGDRFLADRPLQPYDLVRGDQKE
jgi:hypothetical protein